MGVYKDVTNKGIDINDYRSVLEVTSSGDDKPTVGYEFRILYTAFMPDYDNPHWADISVPMWCQMANATMDEVVLNRVLIKMKDPDDDELRL